MITEDQKLMRTIAWLPAKLYELAYRTRVAAYETEYLGSRRLDATVISVGNISVGGTGKTPLACFIASYLKQQDHDVAIITRGYGRSSTGRRALNVAAEPVGASQSYREFGDEPLMIARSLPDVPVVIDQDRLGGGRWAEDKLGSNVLVLDDAYQHLRIHRDLNLLVIDATDPFGGLEMVPFGRLREPLYGLKRADAVIVTRADKPFDQAQTAEIIKSYCGPSTPVMYFGSSITALRHLETGRVYDAVDFRGWNVAVVCGIGNPHAFADDLLNAGINIVAESFFRDHHAFTQSDLDKVTAQSFDAGADAIVTTEKDAVRLEGLVFGSIPLYAARQELQSEDDVRFKSLLLRTVTRR